MITKTGGNLSVLIITEPEQDWQTFATWYSFFKNLPDAEVAIVSQRNGSTPFSYYQWAKRLNIRTMHRNQFTQSNEYLNWVMAVKSARDAGLVGHEVLVTAPLCMAVDVLDEKTLSRISEDAIYDRHFGFIRRVDLGQIIDSYYLEDKKIEENPDKLWVEAKEEEKPSCLVSYEKGCGKWINTAKGCPFSSAGGLFTAEMTANERRVIELWQKMVPLYNAVI